MFHFQSGLSAASLYADDVFNTYLYAGSGASRSISNGIDLAGQGGLVWIKTRNSDATYGLHRLFDTTRGTLNFLDSALTNASGTDTGSLSQFNPDGFSLGIDSFVNKSGNLLVAWTFKRSIKFFDVVAYTGNGYTKTVNHALGQTPGMVIIKRVDGTGAWKVWHRSAASGNYLVLNSTAAQATTSAANNFGNNTTTVDPSATQFTVGSSSDVNANAGSYVAYVFSHDVGTDGLIQCGSYTGNGSAVGPSVSLGWEPQYLLIKKVSSTGNWNVVDSMRGFSVGSIDPTLKLSASGAENGVDYVSPLATGFQVVSTDTEVNASGATYVYVAIRRSARPPSLGTQVFSPIAAFNAQGTNNTTGFPVDLQVLRTYSVYDSTSVVDRLRGISSSTTANGEQVLATDTNVAESAGTTLTQAWGNTGFQTSTSNATVNMIYWNFCRAAKFFDSVCYTGTGTSTSYQHNLAAKPELMLFKRRDAAGDWFVFNCLAATGNPSFGKLNTTDAFGGSTTSQPTSTTFDRTASTTNINSATYVAYLFATLAGVSKVGSYTGNGSSQTINCGFTTGARFVLIKRMDAPGDWYVWDSARGISASNDPHLSLNTTASQVSTDDSIDPDSTGFIINQVAATNINVASASYLYLAIA